MAHSRLQSIGSRWGAWTSGSTREPITYYCGCKLVFGSNYPIQLTQADDALDNRMLVLPFQYAIPREHQNKALLAQLQGEKPEILKLALDAYMNLKRNNFVFTGGVLGPVPTTLPAAMVPQGNLNGYYGVSLVSQC